MKSLLSFSDHYHLAPIKYQWAWNRFQDSLKNHWIPQEIPMGGDKACFEQELSEDEKETFLNVFATLTTSDLCIQENIAENTYKIIGAPEVKIYLSRQIAEEAIHSLSYQHVIEVLGLPDEIYTLYERETAVGNKFRYAEEMGKLIQTENLTKLFKGLFFYYMCFEGIWFYNGFTPIYALQRRNLMRQTGEQLQYIQRDEAQHIAFGVNLLTELSKETNFKLSQREVERLITEAVMIEQAYAEKCIKTYLGYSAQTHIQQAKYLADRRLKQLGYQPMFNVENSIPWLDEQVNIKKEKNFFEQKVIEYQSVGMLDFDETPNIQDISNWNNFK